jgi:hypothetical protein
MMALPVPAPALDTGLVNRVYHLLQRLADAADRARKPLRASAVEDT